MIALDPTRTVRRQNLRTGRRETWEAVSADGLWTFRRLEEPSTPWAAFHEGIGFVGYFNSLRGCRQGAELLARARVAYWVRALTS